MQLSINEMNEILYCIGRVIAQKEEYNHESRQTLFNKLYTELEQTVNQDMKSQGFVPANELEFDEDQLDERPLPVDVNDYGWADWECGEGTLHGCNEECDCPDSSKYYESLGVK